jgi:hypothetical protein
MGRPKIAKELHRKMTAMSLSPEALERIKEYQDEHLKTLGYRINRSQALEAIIMYPFHKGHFQE